MHFTKGDLGIWYPYHERYKDEKLHVPKRDKPFQTCPKMRRGRTLKNSFGLTVPSALIAQARTFTKWKVNLCALDCIAAVIVISSFQ